MATFAITIPPNAIDAAFSQLDRLNNPSTLYKIWANYLESEATLAFKNETSPAGTPWAALSPKYAKRKAESKAKQKILQWTGTLYGSISARAESNGAVVGTNVRAGQYSLGALHQYGTRKMPARPFLPVLSDGVTLVPRVEQELQDLFLDWLAAQ